MVKVSEPLRFEVSTFLLYRAPSYSEFTTLCVVVIGQFWFNHESKNHLQFMNLTKR